MTMSLDLGSGANRKNPFGASELYGVDIVNFGNERIRVCDIIIEPLPFQDNEFDFVTGFDFLEHIPRILNLSRVSK